MSAEAANRSIKSSPTGAGAEPDRAGDDFGPLGELPRVSFRQAGLEHRLTRLVNQGPVFQALSWLAESVAKPLAFGRPEVRWRASGLNRPGVIVQMSWPRLATRFAIGIETPFAHAIVDRLLGFDRLPAENRLQVTPVEWGVLTFVVAETLAHLDERAGALGPWDFALDKVGPDAFQPADLGTIVTMRMAVRFGKLVGGVRLWVPEKLVALWLVSAPAPSRVLAGLGEGKSLPSRYCELASVWRAEAGKVTMPRGLGRLRVGGVLPIDGSPLSGTVQSPSGPLELALRDREGRFHFPAEIAAGTGGRKLKLTGTIEREYLPREGLAVSSSPEGAGTAGAAAAEMPVTLTVELGRINMPLPRLADLKPGDVLELGRHAREPVELTSNGRLVARGELVQIDTELGVRVTNVFL